MATLKCAAHDIYKSSIVLRVLPALLSNDSFQKSLIVVSVAGEFFKKLSFFGVMMPQW
jgi:hypothetical protein